MCLHMLVVLSTLTNSLLKIPHCLPFQSESAWQVKAAENIDNLLESFMGIRDLELGVCTCV